jgi:hypothetical protein
MSLHTLMDYAQLRSQSLNVLLDISLERLQIQAILVKAMKHLLFSTETVSFQIVFGYFVVQGECAYELAKEITGYIRDGFECRWLEIFKTCVVENLAYCSLESGATNPR